MMGELERTARRIAAEMMGLIKDPEGLRLPDDLWQQTLPRAEKRMQGTLWSMRVADDGRNPAFLEQPQTED